MDKKIISLVVVAIVAIVLILANGGNIPGLGSVTAGNEYDSLHVTSTHATGTVATFAKSGYGAIGSVVITIPATAGTVALYDATTTTAYATSTGRLITEFDSASDVAGTYTFDANFNSGLMIDASDTFNGEYTVTWR